MIASLTFPPGFLWGVATSSYQFEGGNTNNQWYLWEQSGHIRTGETAGLACDWWEHAERDFDLAKSMGLNALRLSLEWSRIEPHPGEWDASALSRYREMLRGLRQRGIEPLVTLHHFTDPIWFAERGGFLASDAVDRFERYTVRAVEALGDLCDFWCTINEPNVYAIFGYQLGDFPPGRKGDVRGMAHVAAALARAHAVAYHAIHRLQPSARVGWAQNVNIFDPAHPSSRLDQLVAGMQDAVFNDFYFRAAHAGRAAFPISLLTGDLKEVLGTFDYVGINVYNRDLVAFDLRRPLELFGRRTVAPAAKRGDPGIASPYGEIHPQAIARVARRVAALGKPIYVTENGVPDATDRLRPWVIAQAVRALHDALAAGCDIRGCFHWSLVDNFEWAEGWGLRFGLVALDPATQERTMRRSGQLYGALAHANALTAEMLATYAPEALADVFSSASA